MSNSVEQNTKFVSEWPDFERTLLTVLTWINPVAWPAFFSGEYKGSVLFQSWIEKAASFVATHSKQTRQ